MADIEVCTAREWIRVGPDSDTSRHTVVDELFLRCAPCHQRRHDNDTAA